MAEWLVEEGIGEHRAILIDRGKVVAARLEWPGQLSAGAIADAVLVARAAGSSRGTVQFPSGEEALVDGLPRDASQGAPIRCEVTRAAMAERGRSKLAHARPTAIPPRPAPSLADLLRTTGQTVRVVRAFPPSTWEEILADAADATMAFDGGTLTICPTPAMTLIDIDGTLPPRALAMAAVPAIAAAIARFNLAGSLGIDFPTLPEKADRRAVDEALTAALAGWRHERTAMNGFGFVQLVSRLESPSLIQRIAMDRAGSAARALIRQGERLTDPGAIELSAHPAVLSAITAEWFEQLVRRTGRSVLQRADSALALAAGFAQAVP